MGCLRRQPASSQQSLMRRHFPSGVPVRPHGWHLLPGSCAGHQRRESSRGSRATRSGSGGSVRGTSGTCGRGGHAVPRWLLLATAVQQRRHRLGRDLRGPSAIGLRSLARARRPPQAECPGTRAGPRPAGTDSPSRTMAASGTASRPVRAPGHRRRLTAGGHLSPRCQSVRLTRTPQRAWMAHVPLAPRVLRQVSAIRAMAGAGDHRTRTCAPEVRLGLDEARLRNSGCLADHAEPLGGCPCLSHLRRSDRSSAQRSWPGTHRAASPRVMPPPRFLSVPGTHCTQGRPSVRLQQPSTYATSGRRTGTCTKPPGRSRLAGGLCPRGG